MQAEVIRSSHSVIDINEDLTSVSQIFIEFIEGQKLFYIKIFFEIVINILEILELVFNKREELGMKFCLINFDNFYYDKSKNIIIFQDDKIFSSNYNYKYLMTRATFKLSNKKLKSIQPFVYDEKANDLFINLDGIKQEPCSLKAFYSRIILNFLFKAFRKPCLNGVKALGRTYESFRRDFITKTRDFRNEKDNLNLDKLKDFVSAQLVDRTQIAEINNYYDTEYSGLVKQSLDCSQSQYSFTFECPISEYFKSKQFCLSSHDTFSNSQIKTSNDTFS